MHNEYTIDISFSNSGHSPAELIDKGDPVGTAAPVKTSQSHNQHIDIYGPVRNSRNGKSFFARGVVAAEGLPILHKPIPQPAHG